MTKNLEERIRKIENGRGMMSVTLDDGRVIRYTAGDLADVLVDVVDLWAEAEASTAPTERRRDLYRVLCILGKDKPGAYAEARSTLLETGMVEAGS